MNMLLLRLQVLPLHHSTPSQAVNSQSVNSHLPVEIYSCTAVALIKRWNLATSDHRMMVNLITFFYGIAQVFSCIHIYIHCV